MTDTVDLAQFFKGSKGAIKDNLEKWPKNFRPECDVGKFETQYETEG